MASLNKNLNNFFNNNKILGSFQSFKDIPYSDIKKELSKVKNKTELSVFVGKNLAKAAIKKKIKKVVFDRNGYPFHGRVKAFADAARSAGLEF